MFELNSEAGQLSITLNGSLLFVALLLIGFAVGWNRGIRVLLLQAMVSALAYLLLVSGTEQIIGFVNNIYSNTPYVVAIATGGSPAAASALPPLITTGFTLPLALRIVGFVVAVVLALAFNGSTLPWYGDKPKAPVNRWLGAFAGVLIALIWTSAMSVFWQDYVNQAGNPGGFLAAFLGVLPDVRTFVPLLIGGFALIIGAAVVLNFPRALQPK